MGSLLYQVHDVEYAGSKKEACYGIVTLLYAFCGPTADSHLDSLPQVWGNSAGWKLPFNNIRVTTAEDKQSTFSHMEGLHLPPAGSLDKPVVCAGARRFQLDQGTSAAAPGPEQDQKRGSK